jgi:hypothetical protein
MSSMITPVAGLAPSQRCKQWRLCSPLYDLVAVQSSFIFMLTISALTKPPPAANNQVLYWQCTSTVIILLYVLDPNK